MKLSTGLDWMPHTSVAETIEAKGYTLLCNGVDILANYKLLHTRGHRRVWESLTKINDDWLRVRFAFTDQSSQGTVWIWPVAGDTSTSEPRFDRDKLRITSRGEGPKVDWVIDDGDLLEPNLDDLRFTIGGILHGQGRTVRELKIDFEYRSVTMLNQRDAIKPNHYCPVNPNQTGGNWAYMGISHVLERINREDLYMLGGYGGYFQQADGSWVTEADRPHLQAGHVIHEHSKDRGWIDYSDPYRPWMDRMAVFEVNQDDQHLDLFCPLAQMAMRNPEDEGLQMLLEAAVHVYKRLVPTVARGTTHHESGQERSQGRITKTGVEFYRSLTQRNPKLADQAGIRVISRWDIDDAAFRRRLKVNGFGFEGFTDSGGFAANEIGIHYHGLWRMHEVAGGIGFHVDSVHHWMRQASKWLFDSFKFYDLPGDRRWSHPYFESSTHHDLSGPVSSEHFAWLGATHHEPKGQVEQEKMEHILELGDGFAARFKG